MEWQYITPIILIILSFVVIIILYKDRKPMNKQLQQFQIFIVRPTLEHLGEKFTGLAAERLILGTMLQESRGKFIDQITGKDDTTFGPAVGYFQMEKATHDGIWSNYLDFRKDLAFRVRNLMAPTPTPFEQLASNLRYAIAMCRLKYWRAKEPMPDGDDLEELANYWKDHYNTHKGKGTVGEFYLHAKDIMELK